MAKILGTNSLNGNVSKLVELGDSFLINGQVYDKNTLSPIPFDFCPILVGANNDMILSKTAYVNSHWYRNRTTNSYLIDSVDPSTCYVAAQSILGITGNAYVHKLTKNSNGTWTDTQMTDFLTSYFTCVDLISQDSQKAYFTVNREAGAAYAYIGYINKTTMVQTSVNLGTMGTIKILKDTDMYIYFGTTTMSTTTYNIGKYNKITNAVTWILAETFATGNFFEIFPSDMNSNGVFYAVRDGLSLGMTDHYFAYRKYVLNTTKDTVVNSTVTVDMSLLPAGKIPFTSPSHLYVCNTLIDFTDSVTGKKYINHLSYNRGTNAIALTANDSALYTYEVIDENNWKLVSYTNFNPIIYKTVLPVLNNQTLMLAYENGCHIYTWDTGTTSYKKVSSFDIPISQIGCDSNNNLYIQYADSSIEMISNVMPVTIFADFESDVYNYNGTDITTNVVAYVKNYQGHYLSTSLQINLYGNCKFTDNGTRTKTITTSNLDTMSIPVTITDSGNLKVAVKAL
jgi:hypothetical protein